MRAPAARQGLTRGVGSRRSARAGAINLKPTLDPLRLMGAGLILINIGRVHQAYPILIALRPGLVLVGLMLGYVIMNPGATAMAKGFKSWQAKAIIGLGVLACLSAFFGISIGSSAKTILDHYSRVIVGALLMFTVVRNARDLVTMVWAYVLGCAYLCYFSYFKMGMYKLGSSLTYRLFGGLTYDANDLGCVLMIGLGLALWLFQTSTGPRKWFSAGVMLAIGVTIARSGSRGAFVALLGVGLFLFFALRTVPLMKRIVTVAALAGALFIGAPQGYWDQMSTLLNPKADYNWRTKDGRKQLWMRGIGYMLSYPVFGLGIGNFPRAEGLISEKAVNFQPGASGGLRWATAHNSYIEAGAELGVLGFVLWSALALGGIVVVLRTRRDLPTYWSRGDPEQRFLYAAPTYLPVAQVGFALSAAFVSLAYQSPIYVLAAIVAGLSISVEAKLQQDPRHAPVEERVSTGKPGNRLMRPRRRPVPARRGAVVRGRLSQPGQP